MQAIFIFIENMTQCDSVWYHLQTRNNKGGSLDINKQDGEGIKLSL